MLYALAAFLVATTLAALGQQPTHPLQGDDIGDPSFDWDVILPQTVTQCEPFLIYYNTTVYANSTLTMQIHTPNYLALLVTFTFPPHTIGYLDWICNIPAGYSFIAEANSYPQYYTVQPGSSSDCLGNITAAPDAFYGYQTSVFQSYTQNVPLSDAPLSSSYQQPPVIYPTNSYSTITLNSFLAVASTTSTPTGSFPSSSTLSSTDAVSSHKPNTAAIAAGVVGGVAFVLLTLALVLFFLRKRRKHRSESEARPFVVESGPNACELTTVSSHLRTHSGHISQTDPVDRRNPTSSINPTGVTGSSVPYLPISVAPYSLNNPTSALGSSVPSLPISATLYSSNSTKRSLPSLSIASSVPPTLTSRPSTSETNRRSNLASALDAASRLTANQRQTLIASLNDPADWAAMPSSSNAQIPETLLQSPASDAQGDLPDLATVLGVISRARLSTRERDALVASLDNMSSPNQSTQTNVAQRNSAFSPPPYEQ